MAEPETITCARCSKQAPAVASVPWGGELGARIRERICGACWAEWEAAEVMVINELRLNFMEPESQETLIRHMREFLALDAGDAPA